MSDTHAGENNLYVIQSKIGGSDWVLTVKGDSNYSLRLNHNTVDQRQLWVREDDKGRGGFFLRNPFLDLCLRAGSSQGGNVTMAKKSMDDPEFIWVKERGDDWGCLHKISDSEQKLNVGGNGPYNENTPIIQYEYDKGSDHELWKLVQYDPEFGPTDITYDLTHRTVTLGDPIAAATTSVANRTSAGKTTESATLRVSAQSTITHSVSDTSQDTKGVAETFGGKFSVEKVFEVSASATVTETHSTGHTIGDTFSVGETIDVSASVNVTVEPGKSYDVLLMARHTIMTMPYSATITRKAADGTPGTAYTIHGTYQYKNAYRYDIAVTNVADGTPVTGAVSDLVIQQAPRRT
jgi:hypothetical protein